MVAVYGQADFQPSEYLAPSRPNNPPNPTRLRQAAFEYMVRREFPDSTLGGRVSSQNLTRLAAGKCLKHINAIRLFKWVGQALAVMDQIVIDKNVDVFTQRPLLIDQIGFQ